MRNMNLTRSCFLSQQSHNTSMAMNTGDSISTQPSLLSMAGPHFLL